MTSWLKSIQAELARVTDEDSVEPDYEGCEHDTPVGIADQDMRRLFFLMLEYQKKSKEAAAAVLMLRGKEREEKLAEAAYFDTQADVLKDMFWVSCRHAFPELWAKPNIGIRKGWKVVWTDHENLVGVLDGEGLKEFLDSLRERFGGTSATGEKPSTRH